MEDKPREDPFKDMHPDDALQWGGPLLEPQVSLFLKNPFSLLRQVMGFAISVVVQAEEAKKFLAVWINLVEHFKELMAAGRVQERDDPTIYEIDLQITQPQKVVSLFGEMGIDINKNLQELQKAHTALLDKITDLDVRFFNEMKEILPKAIAIGRENFKARIKSKAQKLDNRKATLLDKIKMFNALMASPTYDNNPIVVEGQRYTKAEMKEEVKKLEREKEKIHEEEKNLQNEMDIGEKFFGELEKLGDKGLEKIRDNENAKNIVKQYAAKIDKAKRSGLTGSDLEKNIKEINLEMKEKLIEENIKAFAKDFNINPSKEYIIKEAVKDMTSSKAGLEVEDKIIRYQMEREKLMLKAKSMQANINTHKSTFGSALNNSSQNKPMNNNNNYKSPKP